MSTHNTVVPPIDENDEAGAPFAESIVIDEGGIDLKIDGETIIGASFEGLDPFRLAYELLPESFTFETPEDRTDYEEVIRRSSEATGAPSDMTDADLELAARCFLTALARRNGYEK